MRKTPHQEQLGFLTFAINNSETDYLNLAYVQALNIKSTQPNSRYAVIVDTNTEETINASHRNVFDYIINCDIGAGDIDQGNKRFDYEWRAFWLTPFKETIKLESDLIFTRNISHWINAFRLKDVCLSHGCRDYQQNIIPSTRYRKLWQDNNLPDLYNGLMYFRYSQTSQRFFTVARYVFENWEAVASQLQHCDTKVPSTDIVYSIAAKMIGYEQCCIPTMDFVNFVHMKPGIQNWSDDIPWTEQVVNELDNNMLRINNINQIAPVHYYEKSFANVLKEHYESKSS